MTPTLREKQSLFTILKAQLVLWIRAQGWCYIEGEGYVADTDAADGDYDGPHKKGGAHYTKLGEDGALFIDGRWEENIYRGGRWVKEGGSSQWKAIGVRWESMHPLCRWGGRFSDDNHLSIFHEGRSGPKGKKREETSDH